MRTIALALLLPSLGPLAPDAAIGVSRAALDRANEALSLRPPKREAARTLLERATSAGDDIEAVAEALYRLGEMDEDDEAFERAIARDLACVSAAPDTLWAARAAERADWLRARSEGNFVPLARLQRIRRDSALADDPTAIDGLERATRDFPPGIVRVEARMLVAEAWLGRMRRPSDAIAELRSVADDPRADPLTAALAERELVESMAAGGAIVEAAAEARAHANRLDPRFVREATRLVRRRAVRRAAIGVLCVFVGLASRALELARRRKELGHTVRALAALAPVAVGFAAFVGLAGGALASSYESGNVGPFLMLGGATLPLVLVARAWGTVGSAWPAARFARALLCGASVLAAAFVLLDVVSPDYLQGFGL
jgi:hypothetical protein